MLDLLLMMNASLTAPPSIVVNAPTGPFDAPRVGDGELATMRGGMELPNGLNVNIGIDLQTRVDGVLLLNTVYSSDGPSAGIHVYTASNPAPFASHGASSSTVNATIATATPTSAAPTVVVQYSPTGTSVQSIPSAPTTNVVIGGAPAAVDTTGQAAVPVIINGPTVTTSQGDYTLKSTSGGAIATFQSPSLTIQQAIGQATGSVVLNTANNRSIDTTGVVNIGLGSLPISQISSLFAMQHLAMALAVMH